MTPDEYILSLAAPKVLIRKICEFIATNKLNEFAALVTCDYEPGLADASLH